MHSDRGSVDNTITNVGVLLKTSISDSTSVQYLVVFQEARIAEEEGES